MNSSSRIQGTCENYYMDFAEVEMKGGSLRVFLSQVDGY